MTTIEIFNVTEQKELDSFVKNASFDEKDVGCITSQGLWAVLHHPGKDLMDPSTAIERSNHIISKALEINPRITPVIRITNNKNMLVECITRIIEEPTAITKTKHTSHVISVPNQLGSLMPVEQIDTLKLFFVNIFDFLVANHGRELYLTEEIATSALNSNRPDIACLSFAEAFYTCPLLSLQKYHKDQYEFVSLSAGDKIVPMFNKPAMSLFEELTNVPSLPTLPKITGNFDVLVCTPDTGNSTPENLIERIERYAGQLPKIAIEKGYPVDDALLRLGNYLVHNQWIDQIEKTGDISFFFEGTILSLKIQWEKSSILERLDLECGCFSRFRLPLSILPFIEPKIPEAVAAYVGMEQGIPFQTAIQKLVKKRDDYRYA